MKKKIKDLTLEEKNKLHKKYANCLCCPYRKCDYGIWTCELIHGNSEREVEIDE